MFLGFLFPARLIPVGAFALRTDTGFSFRVRITRYPFVLATFAVINDDLLSLSSHVPEYRAQIYYCQVHNLLAQSCTL